jgi:hypothetical protein
VDLPRTALLLVASAGVTLVSYRLGRVLGPLEREFLRKSRVSGKEKLLRLL